jgi:hypothetical protein
MKEKIQEAILEQVKMLNEKDEKGEDVFSSYRMELDFNDDKQNTTTAELVRDADIDSVDFNIGFEQGYLRGLETALSLINK